MIYRPWVYQGLTNVVLYASLDFEGNTDRAEVVVAGEPFAVAIGVMREVLPQPRS